MEEARKKINEDEENAQLNKRRRCKRNSSSSSDSEEESYDVEDANQKGPKLQQRTIVWTSAICASEFLANCGEFFATKKLSVSLKLVNTHTYLLMIKKKSRPSAITKFVENICGSAE
jgi:hypothetical protein